MDFKLLNRSCLVEKTVDRQEEENKIIEKRNGMHAFYGYHFCLKILNLLTSCISC